MTYAAPVFLWKPIPRRMEALEGWCIAVQIRCSSSQPTSQPTNQPLLEELHCNLSWTLGVQWPGPTAGLCGPNDGILRGMSSVNLAVWTFAHEILSHVRTTGKLSSLRSLWIWRVEIKIKRNCHFLLFLSPVRRSRSLMRSWLQLLTPKTHGGLCFVPLFLLGNEKRKALFLVTVDLCISSCVFMQLSVSTQFTAATKEKS